MFFALSLLAKCEEDVLGTYDPYTHAHLPPISNDVIDARAQFIDFPDNKIPTNGQTYVRLVGTYKAIGNNELQVQAVFGHLYTLEGEWVTNYTTFAYPCRANSEESITSSHYFEWHSEIDPAQYIIDAYAIVTNTDGKNYSALVLNQTVEFVEITNYKETIGSAFLYLLVIFVLGGIIYLILSKDQRTTMSTVAAQSKASKKKVLDYSEIHTSCLLYTSPSPRD